MPQRFAAHASARIRNRADSVVVEPRSLERVLSTRRTAERPPGQAPDDLPEGSAVDWVYGLSGSRRVVFGVNLLPAFGPPTWAVLVFFRLQSDLAAIPLVLVGAAAAAGGRLALAYGSRRFRRRLSPKRIANLEAAHDAIAGGPKRAAAGLALYALSPLPSAQL